MGAFVIIPFVLAIPPIVGWLIGRWLDKKINSAPYFTYALLALGFMAGIRECYRIIKKYGNEL